MCVGEWGRRYSILDMRICVGVVVGWSDSPRASSSCGFSIVSSSCSGCVVHCYGGEPLQV